MSFPRPRGSPSCSLAIPASQTTVLAQEGPHAAPLVAVTMVLVITKLTRFRGLHLSGKASAGTGLEEGTGNERDMSPHEFTLSSLSVPSQGLSPPLSPSR